MSNFFDGLWKAATHPVDEAGWWKDVVTGDVSLKDAPGAHQRMMNDITVPILGDNKVSKNSDAIAGVIVGGALAAGAGAGGAGGAGAGSSGGSVVGSQAAYSPTTAFGGAGTSGGFSAGSYVPQTQFGAGSVADAGMFSTEGLSATGLGAEGVGWQGSAAGPTGFDGIEASGAGFNWQQFGDVGKYLGQATKQNAPSHNMPRFNPRFSMPEDNSMSKQMVNAAMTQAANQAMSNPWQLK